MGVRVSVGEWGMAYVCVRITLYNLTTISRICIHHSLQRFSPSYTTRTHNTQVQRTPGCVRIPHTRFLCSTLDLVLHLRLQAQGKEETGVEGEDGRFELSYTLLLGRQTSSSYFSSSSSFLLLLPLFLLFLLYVLIMWLRECVICKWCALSRLHTIHICVATFFCSTTTHHPPGLLSHVLLQLSAQPAY